MAAHLPGGNAVLPVRFFKIILKTNLQRLKIPNKFTRIYGGGLSNPVFLKPPYGPEWEVHWTKQNGSEIWFEKGWKQFSENYSLDHGCFVVFTYEGDSKFDVLILGQNNLEIEYPSREENEINLDQIDDESLEILDEGPAIQKSQFFSPPHNKIRDEKATQRNSLSLNWPKDARAQEIAESFNSNNPFFTVIINPGDMVNFNKSVPAGLKSYIENKEKHVKLHIGKRSWNVKLLCFKLNNNHRQFSAGWSLFAKESELGPGDVCVFELINTEEPVAFKVHVYKHNN